MKSVAKNMEVIPTPGTTPYPPAVSGAWAPLPIMFKTHKKLTIMGIPAIYEASCKFLFTGADALGVPVVGNEEVKLKAKKTMLTEKGKGMLLMGDEKKGIYGNALKVVTGNMLKTKPK